MAMEHEEEPAAHVPLPTAPVWTVKVALMFPDASLVALPRFFVSQPFGSVTDEHSTMYTVVPEPNPVPLIATLLPSFSPAEGVPVALGAAQAMPEARTKVAAAPVITVAVRAIPVSAMRRIRCSPKVRPIPAGSDREDTTGLLCRGTWSYPAMRGWLGQPIDSWSRRLRMEQARGIGPCR